jgi:putative component of membrane protein insertase Oxa1/YidC/SpoIIIJ protein YidD
MKALALLAIRLYQRHLSPRKGYGCAYRVHTGAASCSVLGYRAIRRHGAWRGYVLLRRRLEKCGVAHRRHGAHAVHPKAQGGFCDMPCDMPCNGSGAGGMGCDVLSATDSLGECGDWRGARRHRRQDVEVRIRTRKMLGERED